MCVVCMHAHMYVYLHVDRCKCTSTHGSLRLMLGVFIDTLHLIDKDRALSMAPTAYPSANLVRSLP